VSLRIPSSSQSPDHDPHRTIYYLRYPLGRFAGLKHRQLARQVGVIVTTGRIRRTLVNKINLLVDSPRSIEASHLALVKAESTFLRRAFRCLGTSRGSSRRSSSTTLPRAGSSSTTPPRAGSSSTTSPPPRVRVPRHVARLVMRLAALLVVDYFISVARPGALAHRAARHVARRAAHRQLLRLAQARPRQLLLALARRRLLRLRRASGCLGTSRGSSCGLSRRSSSTTSSPPRVRVPRHVARLVTRLVAPLIVDYSASCRLVLDNSASQWLVVDYFASTAHPGASARHAACHAARCASRRRLLRLAQACRRLLRLCRASGCLGTSRGSSRRSSSTTPPRPGSSLATPPRAG
jgi:hypothetical protein